MSSHATPTFDARGQAILLEIEPGAEATTPAKPNAVRQPRAREEAAVTADEPVTLPATPDGSSGPDARALLAEMLPRWALEQAQRELSNTAPVNSASDLE